MFLFFPLEYGVIKIWKIIYSNKTAIFSVNVDVNVAIVRTCYNSITYVYNHVLDPSTCVWHVWRGTEGWCLYKHMFNIAFSHMDCECVLTI